MPFMQTLPRPARHAILGATGIVAVALLLCAIGAAYNAYADARDRKRFTPPGQRIEVAGRKLHLHCTGPLGRYGQPTVVLDAGLGMTALAWSRVQPQIAERVRVCSYDRAGMGFSDPEPSFAPRPSSRLAEELHTLLEYGGVQPPYLLVGHSIAGFHVRAYFNRYPKEVIGAVIVDGSSEYMEERFRGKDWQKAAQAELAAEHDRAARERLFTFLGITRWQLRGMLRSMPFPVEPAVMETTLFQMNQPAYLRTALAELDGIAQTRVELMKKGGLGELPVIVLTAGKAPPQHGASAEQLQERRRIWVHELQPQLAHLSTRGRQIIVDDSGHMIPFEAPHTIVKAVFDVLDEAAALRAQENF